MRYRTPARWLRAALSPRYYGTLATVLAHFERPAWILGRYLGLQTSGFPQTIAIRSAAGRAVFDVYSPDDVVTAIECFAKQDYATSGEARCVVDVGSNIGISVLYFLTQHPRCRVYAFEPDPRNVERLRRNLHAFENRYVLDAAAVGTCAGHAIFGREPTGRYGGLGRDFADRIQVEVRDAEAAIADILAREGTIDILKLDIEGQEKPVLAALSPKTLGRIRYIAAEVDAPAPPLPGFMITQRGGVAIYRNLSALT